MRVCFGTLCFSSRLKACDEEASQVLPTPSPGSSSPPLATKKMSTTNWDQLLAEKDAEILRLKKLLEEKEREINNLRPQLDKFQSVLAVSNPASPKNLIHNVHKVHRPRKQRAGISAEPQNEASILELSKQTFPTIYKDER